MGRRNKTCSKPLLDPRELVRSVPGGAAQVGRHLGITRSAVAMWTVVPPEHCCALELICHYTCEEMRPDIFWPHRVRRRRRPSAAVARQNAEAFR